MPFIDTQWKIQTGLIDCAIVSFTIWSLQKTKYVLNSETQLFEPLQYPIENELSSYVNSTGKSKKS